jgi:hypothetical protein
MVHGDREECSSQRSQDFSKRQTSVAGMQSL